MDDLMARTMVENLALGIDPLTGRALSSKDICSNEIVQEALRTLLDNCTLESFATQGHKERIEKKKKQPTLVAKASIQAVSHAKEGMPWTYMDERQLEDLVARRYSVEAIAKTMHRSPGAIKSRMKKLNLQSKR